MKPRALHLECRYFFNQLRIILFLLFSGVINIPGWSQVQVTHGPIVGAVTSNSARILVRTNSQAVVNFELDPDQSFMNPKATASDTAKSMTDFFVIIAATGLTPNTKYFFRAVVNDTPQIDIRSFMTFPSKGTDTTFSFAFGSCQQAAGDPNSFSGRVFPLMAQDELRFLLQLGDWTYPDTTDTRQNPDDYFNTDYTRVQANYRSKYDPAYPMEALFKNTPIDYVYDDHDFSNNNSDGTHPGWENSVRGYKEMFPHYPLSNPDNGIWHKFSFGNADFFMLDTRTQRDANINGFQQDSTGKYFFRPASGHSLLQRNAAISGELQMDWLIRELQTSSAAWKFICSSVPFNPGHRALLELALFFQGSSFDPIPTPGGFISAAGLAIAASDSWNGFPASVQRLVRTVQEANIANVIILSGDSHTAAIDDGANSLFPEFMAGGLDRSNSRTVALAELFGLKLWNQGGQTLNTNNFNSHYGRVTVFGSDSVRVELVDEFGKRFASYTQKKGHVVSKVGLTYAFEAYDFSRDAQDFDTVDIDSTSSRMLILISTGADTVFVRNISSSKPEFFALSQELDIPPGERRNLKFFFQPKRLGTVQSQLKIESNDPESPFFITLVGKGKQPTAVEEKFTDPTGQFSLQQNYPNPFNAATHIPYTLAQNSDVTLRIFNLRGQEVTRFKFVDQPSGHYLVSWNGINHTGKPAASGVYIYQMQAVSTSKKQLFTQTRKMLLLQ